jgi:3-oxoacyl-[acyl-carrier protein] reductase
MQISLTNQVVIITGGSGGIGKAAAEKFIAAGATVYSWDLTFPYDFPDVFHPMKVDITQPHEVEVAVEDIIIRERKIDVLINNAGITRDASLQKMSLQQWQQVIDVNLTGVFLCTKAVSKHMISSNYGRIINTASVVAHYGNFGQTNYVATKSGVIGMTKVWARELGKFNITVNAVAPGFVKTPMIETVPEKIIDQMLQKSCLKQIAEPEDIANAYLFLASDMAAFITGHTLNVDGGLVV